MYSTPPPSCCASTGRPSPPQPFDAQERYAAWRQWVSRYRSQLAAEGLPHAERIALQVRVRVQMSGGESVPDCTLPAATRYDLTVLGLTRCLPCRARPPPPTLPLLPLPA